MNESTILIIIIRIIKITTTNDNKTHNNNTKQRIKTKLGESIILSFSEQDPKKINAVRRIINFSDILDFNLGI